MSFNIFDDAQRNIHDLDKSPSLLSEQERCDLCDYRGDLIDMIPAPDKGGYYCPDCVKCGDVESYLRRNEDLTPDQITEYLKSIKL